MPELPEVETARRGILPHLQGRRITGVVVREPRLRWPVPEDLERRLRGQRIEAVQRRAKYLLIRLGEGTVLLHLGMSGSLRVVPAEAPSGAHDHVDIVLAHGRALRLRDPRRFGALLWCGGDPLDHPLLRSLGPEPLGESFDGGYLYARARGRRLAVKAFLMDSHVVAGLGNIYANEALFEAGVHPGRAAGRIAQARYGRLARCIKRVLEAAIEQGGTTLRDFVREDGRPGYFRNKLQVYARADRPCPRCAGPLRGLVLGQRATVFCPRCQR
jgi:formamidopyrimidine-DNA glycosylase